MISLADLIRDRIIVCVFLLLLFLPAFSQREVQGEQQGRDIPEQAEYSFPFQDTALSMDMRIRDLLSRLTVKEKVSLLYALAPAIPRLGIEKYYHGNEALHGVVRPGKFTVFPQAIALAACWNPDLLNKIATAISDEARGRWNALHQGKDQKAEFSDLLVFWSPDINLARDPRWGRTEETYGEDPFLAGTMAAAFVKGLQGTNPKYLKTISTPKHFTANNEEHNRIKCNAVMTERSLREYYLVPFEMAVKEGRAESIMSAYNAINGVPCTANPVLLTNILRKEWGFNGYVVSDCDAPSLLYSGHHYAKSVIDAAVLAMNAGLDLECGGYCDSCHIYRDFLIQAYDKGLVSISQIDTAVYRVLRGRFKLGIFDPLTMNPYNAILPSVVGCREHQQLALDAARQSIVLLKNENHFLPLRKNGIRSIAVLGPNAAVALFGGYSGEPLNKPVSILDGIEQKTGKTVQIRYMPWVDRSKELKKLKEKSAANVFAAERQLASASDVVIAVIGINNKIESEGLDKKDLNLPHDQEVFIREVMKANPHTIVVLVGGSPLAIPFIQQKALAILNAWYPGEQGGNAVADILFGDYNPAGRLPLTYYKSTDDLPAFDAYIIEDGRTYMYSDKEPLYPFGFGLSYSSFDYDSLAIGRHQIEHGGVVKFTLTVKNNGPYDGDEVVQVYVREKNPVVKRPLKELKGFQRVHLLNGEYRKITFTMKVSDWRYWDTQHESWKVDPGVYEIMVGGSSQDIKLHDEVILSGF